MIIHKNLKYMNYLKPTQKHSLCNNMKYMTFNYDNIYPPNIFLIYHNNKKLNN
jgi:hypothetical protein